MFCTILFKWRIGMGQLFGKKHNKKCCCGYIPCQCAGRCEPLVADLENNIEIENPNCIDRLPVTLGIDLEATSNVGGVCYNGSGTITFKTPVTSGVNCWEGLVSGSCTDCNGVSRIWGMAVKMCCPDDKYGTIVTLTPSSPSVILPIEDSVVIVIPTSCNPLLVEGCIPGTITGFVVGCAGTMPPTNQIFTNVCFQIYELPP